MNRANLERAAKLSGALTDAEKSLARAKDAKVFRLEMRHGGIGPGGFEYVGHCDGVSEDATGSFGSLADSLHEAAIRYFEFHLDLIIGELRSLGVEI